jgi:hypothetical protein
MQYEYLYKTHGREYKSARLYPETQKELCLKHAEEHHGKVICRDTGEVIADFCRSKGRKNETRNLQYE